MRAIIYISLFFLIGCATDRRMGNAGSDNCEMFRTKAVHCLRDFLTGEDAGGEWQQIGTTPQNLTSLLVGDNPCIEWDPLACGQYNLMYIVGDDCCKDTAYVNPFKCCLTLPPITCN